MIFFVWAALLSTKTITEALILKQGLGAKGQRVILNYYN